MNDAEAEDGGGSPDELKSLMSMSLDQLLEVRVDKVYGASKYAQNISQAPASVTIVTSEEIKKQGYRTLAEVLRSVRGLFVTGDRAYSYLGVHGFGRPSDYNFRVLVLVDGHPMNDNIYDSALLGTEGVIDVDLIDRVEERTAELLQTNEQLNQEIENRKRSQEELQATQQKVIEVSRQAGMAEVATGVLHNVGNVLNSVNVSVSLVQEKHRKSKVSSLLKTADLLREHETEMAAFLAGDPKGKLLPGFVIKLAGHLAGEREEALRELTLLSQNLEHIKGIVAMQQTYARVAGVVEILPPAQLVEDAQRMDEASLARQRIVVVREYAEVPALAIGKHTALQILVNLIRNARHALANGTAAEKRLTIRIESSGPDRVRIVVQDNGEGISPENGTRIFQHGFTTKKDGHGFGLHSGALAAREMGGSLNVHSEGLGMGATFVLELPVSRNSAHPLAQTDDEVQKPFNRAAA